MINNCCKLFVSAAYLHMLLVINAFIWFYLKYEHIKYATKQTLIVYLYELSVMTYQTNYH